MVSRQNIRRQAGDDGPRKREIHTADVAHALIVCRCMSASLHDQRPTESGGGGRVGARSLGPPMNRMSSDELPPLSLTGMT